MSQPDYDQYAEDHQCLLVLVKLIGPQLNPEIFSKIYDRISRNYEFKVHGKQDETFERTIRIRFRQTYSTENNDWGDFQAHRKLLGLITVARSCNDNEIESITEYHNTIRLMFDKTLYDSRCFLLRSKASQQQQQPQQQSDIESSLSSQYSSSKSNTDIHSTNEEDDSVRASDDEGVCLKMGSSLTQPGSECELFDFHIGEHPSTNNETRSSFSTRINRSISSNSLSANNDNEEHDESNSLPETPITSCNSQPDSLPNFLQVPTASLNLNEVQNNDRRGRTHSRNKSLDSRLLSPLPLLQTESGNKTKSDHNLMSPKSSSSGDLKSSISGDLSINRSNSGLSTNYGINSGKNCYEFFDFDSEDDLSTILEMIDCKVKEFLSGLFWVLESKRLAKARDINEKTPALMSPFEEKDSVGLDTETKNYRRKCMARMHKHVGDLCLQAGLPKEAYYHYIHAVEQLKLVGDKLWNASALEGYCACSIILTYPKRYDNIYKLRKHFKLEEKTLFEDLIKRSDYENARKEFENFSKKLHFENSGPSDTVRDDKIFKNALNPDFYYDKYKEAVSLYAMYRHAAVIEFECSLKAARILLFLNEKLKASDFVQNAVFTSFEQTIDQQVERLLKISQLYEQMKFYRKAAFYKRSAAVKCVKSHQNKSLEHCYFLLLVSSYGYGLKLDPFEYDKGLLKNEYQWSKIHVQLLQEMFKLAERMRNPILAMRHLSFMMQCLFNFITPVQKEQYCKKLLELSSRCSEGSPITLRLTNGLTIPSVNFTKFPCLFYFKLEPLPLFLRPFHISNDVKKNLEDDNSEDKKDHQDDKEKDRNNPFIFSALKHANDSEKNLLGPVYPPGVNRVSIFWCQDTLAKITVNLHNFLPVDLRISSIMALTDGLPYEPKHDTTLKIEASTTGENVSISGTPRASGILDITGYRVHALGLKSDCKFSELPTAKRLKLPKVYQVQVTPKLPLMSAEVLEVTSQNYCSRTSVQDCHVSSLCRVPIYSGQKRKLKVQLTNDSPDKDLIEHCKISFQFGNSVRKSLQKMITITWNQAEIDSSLPFSRNLLFDIELEANDGFMVSTQESNLSRNSSSVLSRTSGLRDKLLGSSRLASFINELQTKKSDKNAQEVAEKEKMSLNDTKDDLFFKSEFVELFLKFEYSGTDGYHSGFCRRTSICMNLEILPSALITHWDVLQAEQANECYIVLDIFNATDTEMNLQYTEEKEIAVESQEKCRIPVPIKRLSPDIAESIRNECYHDNELKRIYDCLEDETILNALSDACRDEMQKQIDISWMLSNGDNCNGFVDISQIPFSNQMLRMLLTPLIHGDVYFNDSKHSNSEDEVEIGLGEQVLIQVKLKCTSNTELHNLRLFAITFQDYCLGTKKSSQSLSDRVLVNGTDSLNIQKINSENYVEHEFGYIFLYPGLYRLNICCIQEEQYHSNVQNLLDIDPSLSSTLYLQTFDINVSE